MKSVGSGQRSWVRRAVSSVGNALLDPTVVFSFDRTGFRRHQRLFCATDLDVDLHGRVCVVTGANSGIGYATSLALAKRGAEVWLFCRNPERGARAREAIREASGNDKVFLQLLDVSDLDAIAAAEWPAALDRIDVLVHNAGVLLTEPARSAQGLEQTVATHIVGPLALTARLLGRLQQGTDARLIWVSSGGMYTQKLDVEALADSGDPFDGVRAYARVKRAMVVLSEQLAAQAGLAGVAVHCMHPGWADTPGVQHSIPGFWRVTKAILRSPEEGADTVIWLATARAIQGTSGQFWFDRKVRDTHLLPGTTETDKARSRLWNTLNDWARVNPTVWGAREG